MRQFYVYILASKSRRLYTGITNNLERRIWQHRKGLSEFTSLYRINRLVYFVVFPNSIDAISAERRIKGWRRAKRVALIESVNPTWDDLADGWFLKDAEGAKADPSLRSG